MRLSGSVVAAIFVMVSAVARAQAAPEASEPAAAAPASGPTVPVSRHACVDAHLADMHQEMADHMAKFRETHPTAKHWEIKLERHTFSEQNQQIHQAEIQSVRTACGYKHRAIH